MSNSIHFPELVKILKRILKEKGITYRALAKHLKISESSVKKVFIAEDCSLSRLNQICEAAGVSLADLLSAVKEQVPEKFQFTAKQENFLLANRKSFHVYWKLVYEQLSLEEIKSFLKMSEAALFKTLRGLDQIGLIELLPDGKVRFPDMSMVLWESSGALVDMLRKEWAPLIMQRVGENVGQPGYGLSLRYFTLKPESARELMNSLNELQFEFGRRSVRETRLNRKNVVPVYMVTGFSPSCFVEEL